MWPAGAVDLWRNQVAVAVAASSGVTAAAHSPKRKRGLAEISGNEKVVKRVCTKVVMDENANPRRHENDHDPVRPDASDEQTPRATTTIPPQPHPVTHPLALAFAFDFPHAPSSPTPGLARSPVVSERSGSSMSDASSNAGSGGSKRKAKSQPRTPSPSKRLQSIQWDRYPTRRESISHYDHLPKELVALAKDMRKIGLAHQILGSAFDGWAETLGFGIFEDDSRLLSRDDSHYRAGLGRDPSLEQVRCLHARAIRNAYEACSEAAWNCSTHSFLLECAYHASTYKPSIRWENITTATIAPLLNPPLESDPPVFKKVDFCIALELTSDMKKKLTQTRVTSVNHTDYAGTRFNPIAISIETKPGGDDGTNATLQLAIWAKAHAQFLRTMLSPGALPPPLPLITIEGHKWHMMYYESRENEAILWSDTSNFGDTSTLRGIYQIVAGLQRLMKWAAEEYKPWFESSILPRFFQTASSTRSEPG